VRQRRSLSLPVPLCSFLVDYSYNNLPPFLVWGSFAFLEICSHLPSVKLAGLWSDPDVAFILLFE